MIIIINNMPQEFMSIITKSLSASLHAIFNKIPPYDKLNYLLYQKLDLGKAFLLQWLMQ
jgi:hypothetical protein